MAAVNEEYEYLFANSAYRDFYELSRGEIGNKKVEDVVGEESFEEEIKNQLDLCLQGKRAQYEMTRKNPDLGDRLFKIFYYPLKNEKDIRGIVAVLRDITERRQAEKKLQETNRGLERSKERYQKYFENSGDAIFVLRMGGESHGEILEANSTAEEQTGYTREELVGMNIIEDIAASEPLETTFEEANEKLEEGGTVNYTQKKTSKDGSEYWTEVVVTPLRYEGEKANLSINRDVTQRIEASRERDEQRNKLRNLHSAVEELQHQETEDEVARTAVEVAEKMLEFEYCDISIINGNYLVPKANSSKVEPGEAKKFRVGDGVAGNTMETGETIWGDNIAEHPEAKPTNEEFRAFISVPIGDIGVMQVISKEVGSFDEQDVELTEILAGHMREELERVRLQEKLRKQAVRDPLTDLYNRRYFSETLEKEVEKCKRYDNTIAFIMIDVNRFKEINDSYSHQIGDKVLVEVAKLLKKNVRDADTVVRYGGDEFLVMMPETKGEVSDVVSRINDELSDWNENSDLLDFPLTLAMGVSHWSPEQDRDAEKALNEADMKMYREKRS